MYVSRVYNGRGLGGPGLTLDALSLLFQPYCSLSQMGEGGIVDPGVPPSFGTGNSEEAGKAIPAACGTCLLWPLLSEALTSLFPGVWASRECPLVRRAREMEGCSLRPEARPP